MKKVLVGLLVIGMLASGYVIADERTVTVTMKIVVDANNNYVSGEIVEAEMIAITNADSTAKRVKQENVTIGSGLLAQALQVALETIAGVLDNK